MGDSVRALTVSTGIDQLERCHVDPGTNDLRIFREVGV
jgi:hypothetical protein